MKYSEAKKGRIFIIKLEDGEIIHEKLESFVAEKNIKTATLNVVGGVDKGSILIVGPKERHADKIKSMEMVLDNAYECTGTGTIFPDKNDIPFYTCISLRVGKIKQLQVV